MAQGYGTERLRVEDNAEFDDELDDELVNDLDVAPGDEVETRRAEVEQTRSELGVTLDALQQKLDPALLMDQAKERMTSTAQEVLQNAKDTVAEATSETMHKAYDATIGRAHDAVAPMVNRAKDAGSTVVDVVRANPIPVAMIGLGIAWLVMNNRKNDRETEWRRTHSVYGTYGAEATPSEFPSYESQPATGLTGSGVYTEGYGGAGYSGSNYGPQGYRDAGNGNGGGIGQALDGAKDKVGQAAGAAREKVGQAAGAVKDKVGQAAGTVKDKAGMLAETVQDRAGQVVDTVKEKAGQSKDWTVDRYQTTMDESPLMIGALALGVGLAAGLLIPESRQEHRWMGEHKDRLADRAGQMAQDVVHKVQSVAGEAVNAAKTAAKDEAEAQGLTEMSGTGTTGVTVGTPSTF